MSTFILTIIGGAATIVLGQIAIRVFLDPVIDLKKLQAKIVFYLTSNFQLFANPSLFDQKKLNEVSIEIRKCASELVSQFQIIPWFWLVQRLFGLPKRADLFDGYKNLIQLSNLILLQEKEIMRNIETAETAIKKIGLLSNEDLNNYQIVERK